MKNLDLINPLAVIQNVLLFVQMCTPPALPRLLTLFAAALTGVCLLASPLRAAGTDDPGIGVLAFTIPVPAGKSAAEVQTAVVTAAMGRGWAVKSSTEEKVVIYLFRHKNEATVTFLLSAKAIEAHCIGYKVDKNTGQHIKPEQPEGWLGYLKGDLTNLLYPPGAARK